MFKVKWTGSYPNLCSGEWIISYNGTRLDIPEDDDDEYSWNGRASSDMNTNGIYSRWYFGNDWDEQTEEYEDGLECADWIVANQHWVDAMFDKYEIPKGFYTYHQLFKAIQENDWRSGSCGGCI